MNVHSACSYDRKAMVSSQRGLSLIELMIAMGIGVVLLLGLVQIFGATRAAFNTAEGLSRVQEGGRFVAELMRREIRMAGHLGCINESGTMGVPGAPFQPPQAFLLNHLANPATTLANAPFAFRLDVPVQGFEFTASATGPNDAYTLGAPAIAGAGAFTPPLPAQLGAVTAEAIAGSDILVLRYLSPDSIGLGPNGAAAGVVQVDPAVANFIQAGLVYGLTNCSTVSLFQARTAPDATTGVFNAGFGGLNIAVSGDGTGWDGRENYGLGSVPAIHRYVMSVYYVGIDAGGEPALFRRTVNPAIAAPHIAPREAVVEGVESMQLVFGADNSAFMDDQADIYQTAGAVSGNAALGANLEERWRRVVNVRVGLLVRSPQPASDASQADRTVRVADTVITLPQDGRVRQAYEALVVSRNRVKN
ncbi:MAG: PilW family protein [Aquimonas sp.]|nr:PilW family protein [Aquimonas sp.]